jgi:hypothetical protein
MQLRPVGVSGRERHASEQGWDLQDNEQTVWTIRRRRHPHENDSAGRFRVLAETRQELPVLSNGSTAWRDERAEYRAGQQELQVCWKAPRTVPASAAVEELAAARAQEREDVLEVGCGARSGAERCRIERAAACGEEDEARETAADLEAARADVLVRQPIAREVEDRAQQERRESRPAGGTGRGARRHVKRDDHGYRPKRTSNAPPPLSDQNRFEVSANRRFAGTFIAGTPLPVLASVIPNE